MPPTLWMLFGLVLAALVAVDAAKRRSSWLGWAFLVSTTGPLGLAIWIFVRRRRPVAEPGLGLRSSVLHVLAAIR